MGNIAFNGKECQSVIWVDELGRDLVTLEQICQPEDAKPIIVVDEEGNSLT